MRETTQSQKRRADYIVKRLEGQTEKQAKKALGIKGKKFSQRLQTGLKRSASLKDAPRPGRPIKYTLNILGQALDWFNHHQWELLSKEELVSKLQKEGILPNDAKVEGFYPAFKDYLVTLGFKLKYATRSLTFALTNAHEAGRLKWCIKHQSIITDATVGSYWFSDEVIIEEGGHPKGMLVASSGRIIYPLSSPRQRLAALPWHWWMGAFFMLAAAMNTPTMGAIVGQGLAQSAMGGHAQRYAASHQPPLVCLALPAEPRLFSCDLQGSATASPTCT